MVKARNYRSKSVSICQKCGDEYHPILGREDTSLFCSMKCAAGHGNRARWAKAPPAIDRFEKKYIPEPNTGCWLWTATGDEKGYGHFRYKGRPQKAHRASWMLHRGEIPDGMLVCHHCDTPACVNPDHLFLGTNDDNMRDRQEKGRQARGERAPTAVLTEREVSAIRLLSDKHDIPKADIAEAFGVGGSTIGAIVRRKTWTHL